MSLSLFFRKIDFSATSMWWKSTLGENEVKCRDCRQEGHRSGDPLCQWIEHATHHEAQIHSEHHREEMEETAEEEPPAGASAAVEEPVAVVETENNTDTAVESTSLNVAETPEKIADSRKEQPKPQRSSAVNKLRHFTFNKRKSEPSDTQEGQASKKEKT